ncbi:MAG: imidazolonepropionase [Thermoplasmata archaeon]|jgi:imidazolonepropionase|nr:imidazolonepropionase [Thermoplasmata archaeon]
MIWADLVVTGVAEAATLARGPVPRRRAAAGELSTIPDAAVAVAGGRFVYVGSERGMGRTVRLRAGGRKVDAAGGTLVPGFVDAHTHALFAGDRAFELDLKARGMSYPEIARRGGGILSTVRATRRSSREQLVQESSQRLLAMARSGTTSVEVKTGYSLTARGEIGLLRLIPLLAERTGLRIVPTFLAAHAIPPEYSGRPDAYIDRLIRTALPVVARENLARFVDVFCEPGFFSVHSSERLLRAAAGLGLGTKIHADEFVRSGGARLAARRGARSADHLLAANSDDFRALAAAGVTAVVLPVTAFASAAGRRSPARELVDAGVPVALGTDCSPSTWVESMPLAISLAVHGGRLSPAEALTAATVNAAHASGLEDAGTVEVGRPADFSLFPIPTANHIGYRFDVRPSLVFRQGNAISSRTLRQ